LASVILTRHRVIQGSGDDVLGANEIRVVLDRPAHLNGLVPQP